MLFALAHPVALGALVLGFVVAGCLHAIVRGAVARATHQQAVLTQPSRPLDPRPQVDPFGLVGLALGGVGWLRPLEPTGRWRARRYRRVAVALAGPLANLAVGCAAFVGFSALAGSGYATFSATLTLSSQLRGSLPGTDVQQLVLGLAVANIALGLLELVPIPPLEGGDVLFTLGPPSIGWQRARHHLAEQNWGVAVVLALLLIPLGGAGPALLALLDTIAHPLLTALANIPL